MRCSNPSRIPRASHPELTASITAAAITELMPGAGPPPHRIPIRMARPSLSVGGHREPRHALERAEEWVLGHEPRPLDVAEALDPSPRKPRSCQDLQGRGGRHPPRQRERLEEVRVVFAVVLLRGVQ